ncbi:hypothetical protein P171DRAFT_488140 [Karstenula rhodostoma CBS 690.94]|uniref:Uncharacterized protein n=1 Tax=Karstenula rhodostoma CBS 690.94 TaxID=1392251 RepID=A0A9P4PEH8_9PLEO|nr:hypothetical protein P171DRAFT_488140 [Karstenula rhodostoma CBS 690.94]
MHLFLALVVALFSLAATATAQDLCPKDEYACLDIINSSQCLAQLVIQPTSPPTKENMIKCVETEGVASSLPGAQKGDVSAAVRIDVDDEFRALLKMDRWWLMELGRAAHGKFCLKCCH